MVPQATGAPGSGRLVGILPLTLSSSFPSLCPTWQARTYRLGERDAGDSTVKEANSNDVQSVQRHRVPDAHVWRQLLLGETRGGGGWDSHRHSPFPGGHNLGKSFNSVQTACFRDLELCPFPTAVQGHGLCG